MSKSAVVYWSGTGNTEAMARAVLEGARSAGNEAELFTASEFTGANPDDYDGIAFGCPAMGAEVLEETEFQPMFDQVNPASQGKRWPCSVPTAGAAACGWTSGRTIVSRLAPPSRRTRSFAMANQMIRC